MPTSTLGLMGVCALVLAILIFLIFVVILLSTPLAREAETQSFAAEAEENDRKPGDGF